MLEAVTQPPARVLAWHHSARGDRRETLRGVAPGAGRLRSSDRPCHQASWPESDNPHGRGDLGLERGREPTQVLSVILLALSVLVLVAVRLMAGSTNGSD